MSVGFAQWASGIRNRMAADPGRVDFKDQVQCNGYLFLHEYLDDVLNAPRLDGVIEFAKTPGRNKTASKKARALHASAQKIKPVAPIVFAPGPKDKENDASATSPKQPAFKPPSRSQPNLLPESIVETSGPRDSISRATPARSGVPIFSPANRSAGPLPTPSDDPLSPFRDAKVSQEQPSVIQTNVTAQQIFTTKLAIPSSPASAEKELPPPPAEEPTKAPEPMDQDLSIIQEDDEGQSVVAFEDAREEFTDARSVTTVEADMTAVAPEPAPQRLPSPPASEDLPSTASEPPTPVREPEHEPTEPITSTNITIADIFENAPARVVPPVTAPALEPTKKSLPTTTSQPTPPPEPTVAPTVTSPRPLPIPPSRGNSGSGVQQPLKPPSFAQPMHVPISQPAANPPRASSAVTRGPFGGPSLKDLRREPSVSGNANRELRQSSWRKKPDGTSAVTATTSIGSATTDSEARLKRKSDAVQLPTRPPPSKSQKLSRGSSPSSGMSSEEETEMQVPLKDEDGGSGSWNTGTSMLDDLRNRLARLEKSTSGKTPAASRVWTPTMQTSGLPATGSEKRLSLSDLSLRPASESSNVEKGKEKEKEPEVVGLDLGLGLELSTDDPAASTLSNRSTTPVDSPPPARRVLPAPPVFALPEPATKAPEAPTNTADAVRAAKAEAARIFGATKFTAPPTRTETQTTIATEVSSVFDKATQSSSQFTQSTAATLIESQDAEMEDELDADLDVDMDMDMDPDVDVDGDDDMDADMDEDDAKTTSSRTSTTQTRSMVKKAPAQNTQIPMVAKKTADDQGKASRLREMEERRQAAALRKAEEEKSRTLELEKKRKEPAELAASKGIKPPTKKVTEDPNKKRKLEAESKAAGKKPAVPSGLAQSTVTAATTSSSTKSRIAKPTATPGPSALKSAMKSTTANPFQSAPPASTTKTLKPATSSSSLKATAAKKAKGSISDAPGQALQQQMHARVQAQLKAAQKEPEVQSENIELPDINSEYSDSDDEDRDKDFPSWTQDQALMDALRSQESFNPDALFGPIQPLKMGDLFKTGHSRFRKRTSSANWAGTDGVTVEEEIEYARRMGYINQ